MVARPQGDLFNRSKFMAMTIRRAVEEVWRGWATAKGAVEEVPDGGVDEEVADGSAVQ